MAQGINGFPKLSVKERDRRYARIGSGCARRAPIAPSSPAAISSISATASRASFSEFFRPTISR